MDNPYSTTSSAPVTADARNEVNAPAISLIAVSAIAIAFGILGLAMDAFLLLSGAVEALEARNNGPISEYTQIGIRSTWGSVLLVASAFVLFGALKMKALKSYGTAKLAAIVALVPLVGPCCILGIPFGIWALIVLSKPHVRDSFS